MSAPLTSRRTRGALAALLGAIALFTGLFVVAGRSPADTTQASSSTTTATTTTASITSTTIPCPVVTSLIDEGRLDDAATALGSAPACAQADWVLIQGARAKADSSYQEGVDDLDHQRYDSAVAELEQSVRTDKGSPAAGLLSQAQAEQQAHDTTRATTWTNDLQSWSTLLLWALGALFVVVFLGYLVVRTVVALRKPVRYRFEPIDDPRPDLPVAATLTSAILAELRGTQPGRAPSLEMVGDATDKPDIPDTSMMPDSLRFLVGVLSWIPRPHVRLVSGRAFVAGKTAVVTMAIRRRGRRVKFEQFSAPVRDDATAAFLELAPMIASWLYFVAPDLVKHPKRLRTHNALLGTTSWRSYGHFRQGVATHYEADVTAARRHYLEALAEDQGNLGALINLANLDARATDVNRLARGVDLLAEALRALEGDGQDPPHDQPQWYRVKYLLAVAQVHLWTLLQARDAPVSITATDVATEPNLAEAAARGLQELVTATNRKLCELEPTVAEVGAKEGELAELLRGSELYLVPILASAALSAGLPEHPADGLLKLLPAVSGPQPWLAGDSDSYAPPARTGPPTDTPPGTPQVPPAASEMTSAMLTLERRRLFSNYYDQPEGLESLDHTRIIEALRSLIPQPGVTPKTPYDLDLLSWKAAYNLACYLSRFSAIDLDSLKPVNGRPTPKVLQEAALESLAYAMGASERQDGRAADDPGLQALRTGDYAAEFAALVGATGPPATTWQITPVTYDTWAVPAP